MREGETSYYGDESGLGGKHKKLKRKMERWSSEIACFKEVDGDKWMYAEIEEVCVNKALVTRSLFCQKIV